MKYFYPVISIKYESQNIGKVTLTITSLLLQNTFKEYYFLYQSAVGSRPSFILYHCYSSFCYNLL